MRVKLNVLFVLLILAVMVTGCKKDSNSSSNGTKKDTQSWEKWLKDYEKFVDRYLAVQERVANGDFSATVDLMSLVEEFAQLQTEISVIAADLSTEESLKFMARVEELSSKIDAY